MNYSKSSAKPANRISFKPVSPFDMFYQLTYMSAMAASGIPRTKLFEISARSTSTAATYFAAINTLVQEFRIEYADACRRVGVQAKSENMKVFLLRFSDALRSGEPLADFLAREAEVQAEDYENRYERDLEALKQWTNAFSSIIISVALILIIQIVSSMIYSSSLEMVGGLVLTGVTLMGFGAWIIYRSAPKEIMTVAVRHGSQEQQKARRLFRLLAPIIVASAAVMFLIGISHGWMFIWTAVLLVPIGLAAMRSDTAIRKKDDEFSTFLRSSGSMATSSGSTLRESLTKIELSSFPHLEPDINRLSKRLQALVTPEICWYRFGQESGSRLISEVVDIFYGAIKMGGDPERVGYLCSLFAAKTTQLRAKRRLVAGTFAGLTTVMQAVVAGLMVFVLSIVTNVAVMVKELMPVNVAAIEGQAALSMGVAEFTPEQLQFLTFMTVIMVAMLAIISSSAIIFSSGGYRLKVAMYLAMTTFISGVSFLVVPPMVTNMLQG